MRDFINGTKSILKKGAVKMGAQAMLNRSLPKKIEEKIEEGLPKEIRLLSTRIVNIDDQGDVLTAQIEVKLDTKDADLAELIRTIM